MNSADITALLPFIIIAASAVVVMLIAAIKRNHSLSFIISLIGLASAFISLFYTKEITPHYVSTLIVMDNYALFFIGLIFISTFLILLFSYNYFEMVDEQKDEYYILILISVLGSSVLVSAVHFTTIFLGLEILSVSLYTLISYVRKFSLSIEAGLKYLILAAASSAFLLFGMALIYTETGTMEFTLMSEKLSVTGAAPLIVTGIAMMIVGIGFKLAVVPFHMWTPDVYQGASSPVSSFVASVSKGGMFALLLRFFIEADAKYYEPVFLIFTIIAIASMVIGNLLALLQNNVKRILAYSSIANLGYLLVAFIASGNLAVEASAFYLTSYFIAIITSFGIITLLSTKEREAEELNDYAGLFWRRPFLAAVFTAMLLSLAGIPLTAGFVGKFLVISAGINSTLWLLSLVLVLTSVIGLYYYLRIITVMFSKYESAAEINPAKNSFSGGAAVISLFVLVLWLGIYPSWIMDTIRNLVSSVF